MSFAPKTRLEKILCGVAATAKTRIEKAVQVAMGNAGGGLIVTLTEHEGIEDAYDADATADEIMAAYNSGKAVTVVLDDIRGRIAMGHTSQEDESASFVTDTLMIPGDNDAVTFAAFVYPAPAFINSGRYWGVMTKTVS